MNIRTRLYLIFLSIATVFIAALVYNYVTVTKTANFAAVMARAEGTADLVADLALPCMTAGYDAACWSKSAPHYSRIDQLVGFTIENVRGKLLYDYMTLERKASKQEQNRLGDSLIAIERNLIRDNMLLGKLKLRMIMTGVDAVNENIVWRASSAGLVFLALLSGVLWAASAKLADDMRMLIAAAGKLEEANMPSLPVASPDSDVGKLSASFQTLHDTITEEKHSRTESEELKRDFFAMTVHDLKQPITVLKAVNELMLEAIKEGKYEKNSIDRMAYLAKDSLNRLNSMVEDILNIAKLCKKDITIQKERITLESLIKESAEENSTIVIASGRKWSLETPTDVKDWCIYGDDILIRRVIGNLVLNAIHYTPEGGEIKLGVRFQGKESVELYVSDKGVGIPEKFREEIFRKYTSLSKTAKNVGLGLAFCKLVADRHSAQLSVHSKQGKGTEISITVPVSAPESA